MAFFHPEEFQHTADIHIQETFEDMDRNKDGVLTLEEYIGRDQLLYIVHIIACPLNKLHRVLRL